MLRIHLQTGDREKALKILTDPQALESIHFTEPIAGASVDDYKDTFLTYSVRHGALEPFLKILDWTRSQGISPDQQARTNGESPLMLAVQKGKQDFVRALLAAGSSVKKTNSEGKSILMLGVASQNSEIVKIILEEHPDLETSDPKGKTALLLAAELGDVGTVKALLEAGANPMAKDKDGKTAFYYSNIAHRNRLKGPLKQIAKKLEEYKVEKVLPEDDALTIGKKNLAADKKANHSQWEAWKVYEDNPNRIGNLLHHAIQNRMEEIPEKDRIRPHVAESGVLRPWQKATSPPPQMPWPHPPEKPNHHEQLLDDIFCAPDDYLEGLNLKELEKTNRQIQVLLPKP